MAAYSDSTFVNYGESLQGVLAEFNAVDQNYTSWRNSTLVLSL